MLSIVIFYVFYFIVEVLTVIYFPLSSLSILITSVFNSVSGRLFVFILFSYFLGVLSCCFLWDKFLCLLILAIILFLFLCIR